MEIAHITARMIYDSRGNPTVEADVKLADGSCGRAAVPSGASTGEHEALELRDGGTQWDGKGVQKAIAHIDTVIAPALVGSSPASQKELDATLLQLDGSTDKSTLGANAILAVSLAWAKAAAEHAKKPLFASVGGAAQLPIPMCNIMNGGKHAPGSSDIQEFMIVPHGITGLDEQLRAASEIFHTLGGNLRSAGHLTTVGDEGGYGLPQGEQNIDALKRIVAAIRESGYTTDQVGIALDVAASELYKSSLYNFTSESKTYSSDELIDYYAKLVDEFPIISIEDGLDQNDWSGWVKLQKSLADRIMLVGDDLLVTNTEFIQKAINQSACNAVLIKPNQIGTLTETIEAVQLAHDNDMTTVMSHRSGETEDTTIAHLAVGLGCKYIKTGSMSRSERLAKYNELLRISEQL